MHFQFFTVVVVRQSKPVGACMHVPSQPPARTVVPLRPPARTSLPKQKHAAACSFVSAVCAPLRPHRRRGVRGFQHAPMSLPTQPTTNVAPPPPRTVEFACGQGYYSTAICLIAMTAHVRRRAYPRVDGAERDVGWRDRARKHCTNTNPSTLQVQGSTHGKMAMHVAGLPVRCSAQGKRATRHCIGGTSR